MLKAKSAKANRSRARRLRTRPLDEGGDLRHHEIHFIRSISNGCTDLNIKTLMKGRKSFGKIQTDGH